jgi:hypothetical protein
LIRVGRIIAEPAWLSGALVRVVNLYNPLHGEPGPLDLHPRPWASEGNQPLGSVTYGTVSELFDPLVHNDQGHMYVSMYQEGTTGNGDGLVTATADMTGGEVITYLVAASYSTHRSSGRRNGAMRTYHHRDRNMRPITAGRGLVQLETFGLDEVIAYLSAICTLEPGDLIFTGTPPGVGMARKPPVFLKPGDVVEVEIEGLDVLTNPVTAEDGA